MATDPIETVNESLDYDPKQADPVTENVSAEDQATSVSTTVSSEDVSKGSDTTEEVASAKQEVPLVALQDERTKRQVAEKQVKDLTDRFDKVVASLIARGEKEPKARETPEIPDYTVDPLGHLRTKNELLMAELKAIREEMASFKSDTGQKQNISTQAERLRYDILTYAKTVPDVEAAFQHYTNVEYKEMHDLGWADDDIAKSIGTKVLDVVTRCYASGRNPAEVLYGMAKNKGYAPSKSNGSDSAVKVDTKDPRTVRGFDKTSRKGTKIPSGEAIHAMSEDEFNRFMDENKLTWRDLNS